MSYGKRSYGSARYGLSASLTFFRTFNETVAVQAFRRESYTFSENLVVDVDRVFAPSVLYNEIAVLEDVFSREQEAKRSVNEVVETGDDLAQRDFTGSRDYNELVFVEENSARAIDLFKDEEVVFEDSISRNIEFVRGENILLDSEGFRQSVLERDYDESVTVDAARFFKVSVLRDESLIVEELGPDFGVYFEESIIADDSSYRLRSIVDVDIPGLYLDMFEKYDLTQNSMDLDIEIELIESAEDDPDPNL